MMNKLRSFAIFIARLFFVPLKDKPVGDDGINPQNAWNDSQNALQPGTQYETLNGDPPQQVIYYVMEQKKKRPWYLAPLFLICFLGTFLILGSRIYNNIISETPSHSPSPAADEDSEAALLSGIVTAVEDGITFSLNEQKVMLAWIVAPSSPGDSPRDDPDPLGKAARDYLEEALLGQNVYCHIMPEISHLVRSGRCYLEKENRDIALLTLDQGLTRICASASQRVPEIYKTFENRAARALIPLPERCQ